MLFKNIPLSIKLSTKLRKNKLSLLSYNLEIVTSLFI